MDNAAQNILFIRLKVLGDIVLTLPAVHAIRAARPQARLFFLVSKEFAPLLDGFQDVAEVIKIDRARLRGFAPGAAVREISGLLRILRRKRFSLAIDFQGYGETAFLTWWTRASQRWGAISRSTRKWAYTLGVTRDGQMHPAEFNLKVLQKAGLPVGKPRNEFILPATVLREAERFLAEQGIKANEPFLFIQPLTSSPQKNWTEYVRLAKEWRNRGVPVVFGGGPQDRAALEPLRHEGFVVSAGVPLLVSAGLTKLARVILGGDTGLLHLAVAMGKRVVMMMPSNTPGNCHPFQHPEWAITPRPEESITSIRLEEVMGACERAWAEKIE